MAYGVNGPFGLRPVRMLNGATWNGQANNYTIDTAAGNLYTGDPVKAMASGAIQPAAAGDTALGVFIGCTYRAANPVANQPPSRNYWLNGTPLQAGQVPVAFVVDDPNVVYQIQVNAAGSIAATNIFNTANWAAAAGSATTGISAYTLDYATIGTSANNNLKILGILPTPQNAFGLAYNVAEVIINNGFIRAGVAGV